MLTPCPKADLADAVTLINASYRGESARAGWTNENGYIDGERTSLDELRADLTANPAAALYLWRDDPADQP